MAAKLIQSQVAKDVPITKILPSFAIPDQLRYRYSKEIDGGINLALQRGKINQAALDEIELAEIV